MNLLFNKTKRGFSLVEMLIYVAILSFMVVVIVNILTVIVSSQRTIKSTKSVENSGIFAIERIVREVRDATTVITGSSSFGANPGVLTLGGYDEDGNPKTIEFSILSGAIHLREDGVDLGAITQSEATVTSLIFNYISGTTTQMVRTRITIEAGTSTSYRSENFYSTTILRGSL